MTALPKKLQQAVSKLHIGDGLEKGVTIGPLIDEKSGSKSGRAYC